MSTENPIFEYSPENPTNLPEYLADRYFRVLEKSNFQPILSGEIVASEEKILGMTWKNRINENNIRWSEGDLNYEFIDKNYDKIFETIKIINGETSYEFCDTNLNQDGFEIITISTKEFPNGIADVAYLFENTNGNEFFERITRWPDLDNINFTNEIYISQDDDGMYGMGTYMNKEDNLLPNQNEFSISKGSYEYDKENQQLIITDESYQITNGTVKPNNDKRDYTVDLFDPVNSKINLTHGLNQNESLNSLKTNLNKITETYKREEQIEETQTLIANAWDTFIDWCGNLLKK